jgi:hypothetical protein
MREREKENRSWNQPGKTSNKGPSLPARRTPTQQKASKKIKNQRKKRIQAKPKERSNWKPLLGRTM